MTLITTIPFRVDLKETDVRLKYPDLYGSAFTSSIVINGISYIVRISYSLYSQSALFSLLSDSEIPIVSNVMMSPQVNDITPNLLNIPGFENYYLVWNIDKGLQLYLREEEADESI